MKVIPVKPLNYTGNKFVTDLTDLHNKRIAITGLHADKGFTKSNYELEYAANMEVSKTFIDVLKPSVVLARLTYICDFTSIIYAASKNIPTCVVVPFADWDTRWDVKGHSIWRKWYAEAIEAATIVSYLYPSRPDVSDKDLGTLVMKPVDYKLLTFAEVGVSLFDSYFNYKTTAAWFFKRATELEKPCLNLWKQYQFAQAKQLHYG